MREVSKPQSDPRVELRNLRTMADADPPSIDRSRLVAFNDREGRSLVIERAEWEQLGCPAYVVVGLRTETFAESTQ